jgi:hypothetical protein
LVTNSESNAAAAPALVITSILKFGTRLPKSASGMSSKTM